MTLDVTARYETDPADLLLLRQQLAWRDLVPLRWWEKLYELALSAPWLAASLLCYQRHWILPGAVASFFFFLTGLRQSHNAQHYALGLPRLAQDFVLAALSLLMFGSMHAVQVTHMHHHRHCLDHDDIEAGHANEKWYRVLLTGPLFPLRLHRAALRFATPGKRAWILSEILLITAATALLFLFPAPVCLRWHALAMITGQCFTGFFAVWTVHHGCDEHTIARTQRGWMKNFLSYSMFYHLEHHLFPAVPTPHLPELARRLDQLAPAAAKRQVI